MLEIWFLHQSIIRLFAENRVSLLFSFLSLPKPTLSNNVFIPLSNRRRLSGKVPNYSDRSYILLQRHLLNRLFHAQNNFRCKVAHFRLCAPKSFLYYYRKSDHFSFYSFVFEKAYAWIHLSRSSVIRVFHFILFELNENIRYIECCFSKWNFNFSNSLVIVIVDTCAISFHFKLIQIWDIMIFYLAQDCW